MKLLFRQQVILAAEVAGHRTHTIAFTPLLYRSHMERNLGCPPRSQLRYVSCRHQEDTIRTYHFNVTWPFWTRFMLKPTVGMELWRWMVSDTPCSLQRSGDPYSMVNSPP